jgi:hypothetical protein
MKLTDLKQNPKNPRIIKDDKFKKLVKSLQEFPEMMEKRPMVCVTDSVDGKLFPLGGNMRLKALQELKYKDIPDSWVMLADDWTEEKRIEFAIRDNVSYGDWDWDWKELANDWDADTLEDWGLDMSDWEDDKDENSEGIKKATEILSGLKYEPLYYEPIEKPNINLFDCINFDKYNAKIKAIDEYDLTTEQKEVLKFFAYRFIKIDFENVANYYSFNASDEEQKAIERLRLVLTDTGLNGFVEDDLLKIMKESIDAGND